MSNLPEFYSNIALKGTVAADLPELYRHGHAVVVNTVLRSGHALTDGKITQRETRGATAGVNLLTTWEPFE